MLDLHSQSCIIFIIMVFIAQIFLPVNSEIDDDKKLDENQHFKRIPFQAQQGQLQDGRKARQFVTNNLIEGLLMGRKKKSKHKTIELPNIPIEKSVDIRRSRKVGASVKKVTWKKELLLTAAHCNSTIDVNKKQKYTIDVITNTCCSFIFRAMSKRSMIVECKTINLSANCKDESFLFSNSSKHMHRFCGKGQYSVPTNKKITEVFLKLQRNVGLPEDSNFECTVKGKKNGKGYIASGEQLCPLSCGQSRPETEAENIKIEEAIHGNSSSVNTSNYDEHENRIVGGKSADVGEWPWMVFLSIRSSEGDFICGATLITPRHVLTAGHCVHDIDLSQPGHRVRAAVGRVDLADNTNIQKKKVKSVILHPKFVHKPLANDIAVLVLKQEFKLNDHVKLVCLAPPRQYEGKSAVLLGWGVLSYNGKDTDLLQEVTVQITNTAECAKNYSDDHFEDKVTEDNICNTGPGHDSCGGDSGGPLLLQLGTSWYQAGIISFGKKCAKENFPGVNTYVPSYISWILSVVNNEQTCG